MLVDDYIIWQYFTSGRRATDSHYALRALRRVVQAALTNTVLDTGYSLSSASLSLAVTSATRVIGIGLLWFRQNLMINTGSLIIIFYLGFNNRCQGGVGRSSHRRAKVERERLASSLRAGRAYRCSPAGLALSRDRRLSPYTRCDRVGQ